MKVANDLKNVYVWDTVRRLLPLLANAYMLEGNRGRKFTDVSLGDAASMAIMEACRARGLELTPAMQVVHMRKAPAASAALSGRVEKRGAVR